MKASARNGVAVIGAKRHCRRYQCHYCSHSSNSVILMQGHVMTCHLNYRPYLCPFCDFRTIRSNLVKRHVRLKHPTVSHVKCQCLYRRDDSMDSRLKNAFYSFSLNESASKYLPVLQDHTYNALSSVVNTTTASNLHQNEDSVSSSDKNAADSDAPKVTVLPEKSELHADCGSWNFYHCGQCAYSASGRSALKAHITREHRKLKAHIMRKCTKLKCLYCSAVRNLSSDMFVHWFKHHQHLPFKYNELGSEALSADDTTEVAAVETVVTADRHMLSELDSSLSNVPGADVPSSEAAMSISALTHESADAEPCEEVNDVIYCCETCPSSFSTSEALLSHECTSSMKRALDL